MRSLTAALFIVLFVTTACAGSTAETATTDGGSETNEPAASSTTFEDINYESPVADFLGQDIGSFDRDEAAIIEQQREAERSIARCMAEKGFEYIPRDPAEMMSFGGQFDDEFEPFSDAWIAKYGFGISTQRFAQSMVGDLVGIPDEMMFGPGPDLEDPNDEYLQSLSDSEREAYQEALYGLPPDFGPSGPTESFEFEPDGCQFEAFSDGPGGQDNVSDFYQAFGDEMRALRERIEADSRVVAFNSDISACVAERGMQWTTIQDVYQQFEPRLNQLEPDSYAFGDPLEASGLDPEEMSERALEEFYLEASRLDAGQLAILAEIQADEIALAQAVIECGGGPVAEQILMNEVRVEYELAFLEENAAEIAQYAGE